MSLSISAEFCCVTHWKSLPKDVERFCLGDNFLQKDASISQTRMAQPLFPIQFREVEACKYQIIVERLPPNKILLRFSRNFSCTRSSFEFNFDFGRNRPIKITLFIHCQKIIEIPHSYLIHRSFPFKLKYIESDIFRRNIISAKWPPLASLQTSTSLLKVLLAF